MKKASHSVGDGGNRTAFKLTPDELRRDGYIADL